MSEDEPEEPVDSRRTIARRERKDAGLGSARLAKSLMTISKTALAKLELEEDLLATVDQARGIKSHQARRRAERALAGELRQADLGDLEIRLNNVLASGVAEPRLFQAAERWRTRLIEEGPSAAAEFPGGAEDSLVALIERAQRQRDTGKPPGAARALFRHIFAILKAQQSNAS